MRKIYNVIKFIIDIIKISTLISLSMLLVIAIIKITTKYLILFTIISIASIFMLLK